MEHSGEPMQHSFPQRHKPGTAGKRRLCPDRRRTFLIVVAVVWLIMLWWLVGPRFETTMPEVDYFSLQGTHNNTPLVFNHANSSAWIAHPHLVVIGIMMGNDKNSFLLRVCQSNTWGHYDEVARQSNGFKGLVLPLYVAGTQTNTPPYWHPDIKALSDAEGNIVITRILERASTTEKQAGKMHPGGYGPAAEMTTTRKMVIWFIYAYNHFRYTPFIAKGDLDIYLNVPAYLTVVQQLPRVSTLYGKPQGKSWNMRVYNTRFQFLLGPLYTHSRDIVVELTSDDAVLRLVEHPYRRRQTWTLRRLGLFHEDNVHSLSLYRRYLVKKGKRRFPMVEWRDALKGAAQLPPVAGLGKLYMDYVANITRDVPLSGRVDGLLGYSYDYKLPGPIDPLHFVMVQDTCRLKDEYTVQLNKYRILTHRTSTPEMFRQYFAKDFAMGNTLYLMPEVSLLNVTDFHNFLYLLDLCNGVDDDY